MGGGGDKLYNNNKMFILVAIIGPPKTITIKWQVVIFIKLQNDTMYYDVDGINLLSYLLCYRKKFHILSVLFNVNFFNYKTRYILFPANCP